MGKIRVHSLSNNFKAFSRLSKAFTPAACLARVARLVNRLNGVFSPGINRQGERKINIRVDHIFLSGKSFFPTANESFSHCEKILSHCEKKFSLGQNQISPGESDANRYATVQSVVTNASARSPGPPKSPARRQRAAIGLISPAARCSR